MELFWQAVALIAVLLSIVALVMYIIEWVNVKLPTIKQTRNERRVKALMAYFDAEMQKIEENLEPRVDFWWTEKGQEYVRKHINPEEYKDIVMTTLVNQTLDVIRGVVLDVALTMHARTLKNEMVRRLRKLKRSMNEPFIDATISTLSDGFEEELRGKQQTLVHAGIDLEAFEAEFAPTK